MCDLAGEGRQFLWEREQQEAFGKIRHGLQGPLILHLPNRHGRFQLCSGMSEFATGGVSYQIWNGQPGLIACAGGGVPEAAGNCSVTELEVCGLAVNVTTFSHLLKRVDFNTVVDHLPWLVL